MSDECRYYGCANRARQADIENRNWHPEDPRSEWVFCDYHRSLIERHTGEGSLPKAEVPIEERCLFDGCLLQHTATCSFCHTRLCAKHRYPMLQNDLLSPPLCITCYGHYREIRKQDWFVRGVPDKDGVRRLEVKYKQRETYR